jgi:hypothetical protein
MNASKQSVDQRIFSSITNPVKSFSLCLSFLAAAVWTTQTKKTTVEKARGFAESRKTRDLKNLLQGRKYSLSYIDTTLPPPLHSYFLSFY